MDKNMANLLAVFAAFTLFVSLASCQNVSVWIADSPGELVYQVRKVGTTFNVQCKVRPVDAVITWFRLPSMERISIKKSQERIYTKRVKDGIISLNMDNVVKQDSGVFKCVAESNGKKASSVLNVTVDDLNFCGFEFGFCGFWDAKGAGSKLNMAGMNVKSLAALKQTSGQLIVPGRSRLTGPSYDVTLGPQYHNGKYVYLESGTKESHRVAMLVSFLFNSSQSEQCFSFWFHAWGPDVGKVGLSLIPEGGAVLNRTLLKSVSGSQGNIWKLMKVPVPATTSPYRLIIELEKKAGGDLGDVAIDDLRWYDSLCNETEVPDPWSKLLTPIRLVDGTKHKEGRVEVLHEGEWGTISSNTNDLSAGVICKLLGFGDKKSTLKLNGFYPGGEGLRVWAGGLNCSGTEQEPMACRVGKFEEAKHYDHSGDIGVVCLDECVDQPCGLHGECSNTASGYGCRCNFGYSGSDCEARLNSSEIRLVDTGSNDEAKRVEVKFEEKWQTFCPFKWGNNEAQVVCSMQGKNDTTATAISGGAPSSLEFNTTAWSLYCNGRESDLIECQVLPVAPGYECLGKYVAVRCNDYCASSPCLSNGTCTNSETGFNCTCPDGIFGATCDDDGVDDCAAEPCKNGGTCNDGVKGYTCACPVGKTGKNCEDKIDFCDPNPCKNNKGCKAFPDDFKCDCGENWKGKDCSQDVDECVHMRNPCPTNATCSNLEGGYGCVCPPGVSDPHHKCTSYVQPKCPPMPDIPHGTKQPYPTMVKYTCDRGYLLDGHQSRECGRNGSWIPTNDPPQCIEDDNINHKRFSPKVFTHLRYWKGEYVYRGATFEFEFSVSSANGEFFGNITGDFHDKISKVVLTGSFYPPSRLKLKLLKGSGEPRFDQPKLVLEGNMTNVQDEWQCHGAIIAAGFGQFYMVPSISKTIIHLPENVFIPGPEKSKQKSSKKTVAIVLPILFLVLAMVVCAVIYIMYRHGRRRNRYQGATRFENPIYEI